MSYGRESSRSRGLCHCHVAGGRQQCGHYGFVSAKELSSTRPVRVSLGCGTAATASRRWTYGKRDERGGVGNALSARRSTGLGLSIVKLLTEKMGDTITAEYENGHLQICIAFQ